MCSSPKIPDPPPPPLPAPAPPEQTQDTEKAPAGQKRSQRRAASQGTASLRIPLQRVGVPR